MFSLIGIIFLLIEVFNDHIHLPNFLSNIFGIVGLIILLIAGIFIRAEKKKTN